MLCELCGPFLTVGLALISITVSRNAVWILERIARLHPLLSSPPLSGRKTSEILFLGIAFLEPLNNQPQHFLIERVVHDFGVVEDVGCAGVSAEDVG